MAQSNLPVSVSIMLDGSGLPRWTPSMNHTADDLLLPPPPPGIEVATDADGVALRAIRFTGFPGPAVLLAGPRGSWWGELLGNGNGNQPVLEVTGSSCVIGSPAVDEATTISGNMGGVAINGTDPVVVNVLIGGKLWPYYNTIAAGSLPAIGPQPGSDLAGLSGSGSWSSGSGAGGSMDPPGNCDPWPNSTSWGVPGSVLVATPNGPGAHLWLGPGVTGKAFISKVAIIGAKGGDLPFLQPSTGPHLDGKGGAVGILVESSAMLTIEDSIVLGAVSGNYGGSHGEACPKPVDSSGAVGQSSMAKPICLGGHGVELRSYGGWLAIRRSRVYSNGGSGVLVRGERGGKIVLAFVDSAFDLNGADGIGVTSKRTDAATTTMSNDRRWDRLELTVSAGRLQNNGEDGLKVVDRCFPFERSGALDMVINNTTPNDAMAGGSTSNEATRIRGAVCTTVDVASATISGNGNTGVSVSTRIATGSLHDESRVFRPIPFVSIANCTLRDNSASGIVPPYCGVVFVEQCRVSGSEIGLNGRQSGLFGVPPSSEHLDAIARSAIHEGFVVISDSHFTNNRMHGVLTGVDHVHATDDAAAQRLYRGLPIAPIVLWISDTVTRMNDVAGVQITHRVTAHAQNLCAESNGISGMVVWSGSALNLSNSTLDTNGYMQLLDQAKTHLLSAGLHVASLTSDREQLTGTAQSNFNYDDGTALLMYGFAFTTLRLIGSSFSRNIGAGISMANIFSEVLMITVSVVNNTGSGIEMRRGRKVNSSIVLTGTADKAGWSMISGNARQDKYGMDPLKVV